MERIVSGSVIVEIDFDPTVEQVSPDICHKQAIQKSRELDDKMRSLEDRQAVVDEHRRSFYEEVASFKPRTKNVDGQIRITMCRGSDEVTAESFLLKLTQAKVNFERYQKDLDQEKQECQKQIDQNNLRLNELARLIH